MTRARVWQGLLEWWRPRAAVSSSSPSLRASEIAEGSVARLSWPSPEMGGGEGLRQHALALDPEAAVFTEALEITDGELLEFLACDLDPTEADPEFREQLREQLWEMVERGVAGRRRDH